MTSIGQRTTNVNVEGHEEADTKIAAHVMDMLEAGFRVILILTTDTDVVVIHIWLYAAHIRDRYPDADIWIGFGPESSFRYYHVNTIFQDWGIDKCLALPFFHALTGSDTTSQFLKHGKKTAWSAWATYPYSCMIFKAVADVPFCTIDESSTIFKCVERFVCLLYDQATDIKDVNELRREMFAKIGTPMETLPPTKASLLQHVRRSIYQASLWYESCTPLVGKPSPELFGWKKVADAGPEEFHWAPHWSDLPPAATGCRELVQCGCKALPLCTRKCRCHEAGLPCTTLCNCQGNCDH